MKHLSLLAFPFLLIGLVTSCDKSDDKDPVETPVGATAGDEDDDDGPVEPEPTSATGDNDEEEEDESTTEEPMSSSEDTEEGCPADAECREDTDCPESSCLVNCTCAPVAPEPPTDSDYGACSNLGCPAGHQAAALPGAGPMDPPAGCFCAPACDGEGAACPEPSTGMPAFEPICGITLTATREMPSDEPTHCAIPCNPAPDAPAGQCPGTSACILLPGGGMPGQDVGLCAYPVPM